MCADRLRVRMENSGDGYAPADAHLVGSVPLRSADEVFRVLSERLGDRVRQLPDGETGPRADWIVWQYPVLSSRPQFEVAQPAPGAYRALPAPPARHAPEVGAGSPSTEPVKRS